MEKNWTLLILGFTSLTWLNHIWWLKKPCPTNKRLGSMQRSTQSCNCVNRFLCLGTFLSGSHPGRQHFLCTPVCPWMYLLPSWEGVVSFRNRFCHEIEMRKQSWWRESEFSQDYLSVIVWNSGLKHYDFRGHSDKVWHRERRSLPSPLLTPSSPLSPRSCHSLFTLWFTPVVSSRNATQIQTPSHV